MPEKIIDNIFLSGPEALLETIIRNWNVKEKEIIKCNNNGFLSGKGIRKDYTSQNAERQMLNFLINF